MITLALEERTVRQLKKLSVEKKATITDLAETAIREYIQNEEQRLMHSEMVAYRKLHKALWERYPGEFVAVFRGQVIDRDVDQTALFLRIDQKHPDDVVMITQVLETPDEEYQNISARLDE